MHSVATKLPVQQETKGKSEQLFSGGWINVVIGIPQGSVLGPLLFNIFINDLFLPMGDNDPYNFADDNTLYKCSDYLSQTKRDIEAQCSLIIRWFSENSMKLNPEKCAFILEKEIMPEILQTG